MRSSVAITVRLFLFLLIGFLLCGKSMAQGSFGYSVLSISMPPEVPPDTKYLASEIKHNKSLEFVFMATWVSGGKAHDAVCTPQRIIADRGDIINGKKIVHIREVDINNAGDICYRADITEPSQVVDNAQALRKLFGKRLQQAIFVNRKLRFVLPVFAQDGPQGNYFRDDGTVYYEDVGIIHAPNINGDVTDDGIHWSKGLPADLAKELDAETNANNKPGIVWKWYPNANHDVVGPNGLVLKHIDTGNDPNTLSDKDVSDNKRQWMASDGKLYGPYASRLLKTDALEIDLVQGTGITPLPVTTLAVPGNQAPAPEPPPCPHYQEMQAEAKELKQLADTLETNDQAYQEAVIDMLVGGYDSDFAILGLDVKEDDIPGLFDTPAAYANSRIKIVRSIREKARVREEIADIGIKGDYAIDPVLSFGEDSLFSKDAEKYFCSPDPKNITDGAWRGLYEAGYIDVQTYKDVKTKTEITDLLTTAAGFVIMGAAEKAISEFFAVRFTSREIFLSAVQARLAQGIAKGVLPKTATKWVVGKLLPEFPAVASLSKIEARLWYHRALSRIPLQLDKAAPLEVQAREAWALRYKAVSQTRAAMTDRVAAADFDPAKTWEQVLAKYQKEGLTNDELWRKIIKKSQESNKVVNKELGL